MSQEDIPQEDWHKPAEEITDRTYLYVQQFSKALDEYLLDVMGEGDHHLVDLSANTASFATALFHITNNF